MAHDIFENHFVHTQEAAWHGLGLYLGDKDNATVAEVLNADPIFGATINYKPALVDNGQGGVTVIPGAFVPFLADKSLDCVVGSQHCQSNASPKRLLDAVKAITGEGKGNVHTAMLLDSGRRCVLTVSLGKPLEVKASNGKVDETRFYLTAATAFDGSLRTHIFPTAVRVVCANTFRSALCGAENATRIKHTQSHEQKLVDAEKQWSDAVQQYENFKRTIEIMAKAPVTDMQALALFRKAFGVADGEVEVLAGKQNKINLVNELYHNGMGNADFTGTAWGAFNALTEYADHNMVVRGVRDSEGKIQDGADMSKLVNASLFGAGATFKQNAMDIIQASLQLA